MYLQRVIEEVSGAAFNDFMIETIFTPLGMSRSSYFRASRTAPRSRGHGYLLGFALPMPFAPNVQANAANLLCSTAPDLAKFVAELMAPTLVSQALVEQMLTPQVPADQNSMVGLGDRTLLRFTIELLLALGRQPGLSELPDRMPARENRRRGYDQQFSWIGPANRRPRARTLTRSTSVPQMTR
jgi:CubicO group peptidase (beta-lactamase class C family)